MIVGVLSLQLMIPDAMSLKDKRRVIKSLKDRVAHKFNVSIAEVGHNDNIRSSLLGVAVVANESRFADSVLSSVVEMIRRTPPLVLIDYSIERAL